MPDFMPFSKVSPEEVSKLDLLEASSQAVFLAKLLCLVLDDVLPDMLAQGIEKLEHAGKKVHVSKKRLKLKSKVIKSRVCGYNVAELRVWSKAVDGMLFWHISPAVFKSDVHAVLYVLLMFFAWLFNGFAKAPELRASFWARLGIYVVQLLDLSMIDFSGLQPAYAKLDMWKCESVEEVLASLTLRGYDVSKVL